jgi:hypothetical protein
MAGVTWFPKKPSTQAESNIWEWRPWFQSIWRFVRGEVRVNIEATANTYLQEEYCYPISASGAARTVTLPAANIYTFKKYLVIKTDTSANKVTFALTGSDTLEASVVPFLQYQGDKIEFLSDGVSKWYILNRGNAAYPVKVAAVTNTNKSAAIAANTIYAVPADGAGFYRVSWVATVTTAATTSSGLGGTATQGMSLTWTDPADNVAKTTNAQSMNNHTSQANTTTTTVSGTFNAYCKASTNLQYAFNYVSVGATAMVYDLYVMVEYLGP